MSNIVRQYPITSALGPGGMSCVYFRRDDDNLIAFYNAQQALEYTVKGDKDARVDYTMNNFVAVDGKKVQSSTKNITAFSYRETVQGKEWYKIRLYYVDSEILKELCLDLPAGADIDKHDIKWYNGSLNRKGFRVKSDSHLTCHVNNFSDPWQLKVYAFESDRSKEPTVAWADFGSTNWKSLEPRNTIVHQE